MQWIIILCGLALLLLAVILTYWLRGRTAEALTADSPYLRPTRRLRMPRRTLRLLRKAMRISPAFQAEPMLLDAARQFIIHLSKLRSTLQIAPALPGAEDDIPRIMAFARNLVDAGNITPDSLADSLSAIEQVTPAEAAYFPQCAMLAQCDRLNVVLLSMLDDAKAQHRQRKLVRRLKKHPTPAQLLNKLELSPIGLHALLNDMRESTQPEIHAALEEWLYIRGTSADEIAQRATQRKVLLAEEIRSALHHLDMLSRLNWLPRCEATDPVHALLMEDPARVYGRMTPAARLDLRLQVEKVCRVCKLAPDTVISQALQLAQEADNLEAYIGYWFQEADGLHRLQQALPTRRGKLFALLSLRRQGLSYAGLWLWGMIAGFLFVQGRQPVFMLPFFVVTAGYIIRRWIHPAPSRLPCMEISPMSEELRTLVILPATLHDPHEAIRMVRRLKILRHAFCDENADFLLLGDFGDNMTAVSSTDAGILQAAASAVAALGDERYLYLHRARTWDPDRHTYTARGGQQGAICEICRLIVQGECTDVIAYASTEAASLERKYAYVMVVQPDHLPAPGTLTALLQRMTHPLSMRYPVQQGWRGYAVLAPEGNPLFDGVGLLRPDAFLEATDGMADPHRDAASVYGELAGYANVPTASHPLTDEHLSWEDLYFFARQTWQTVRWQLPYVQTPSGLVRNPLSFFSRFRLREQLRRMLLAVAQLILLLWAVLTNQWLLLIIALSAPEVQRLPRQRQEWLSLLQRISLLPTRTLIPLRALLDLFRRKVPAPAWDSLEIWAQWLCATLLTALGLALPHMTVPALALGVLFAGFPWVRQLASAPLLPRDGLTQEQFSLLEDIATGTWRYFSESVTAQTNHLPPLSLQYEPPLGASAETSPEAIGAYLLACVCAKELDLLSANAAASRLQATLDTLSDLAFPYGLPCRRYSLTAMIPTDASSDAGAAGFLLASLMTTAQALRSWLPELSGEYTALSANAEQIISSFDISRLFDPEAQLFHRSLNPDGQADGYIDCFPDEALLLSMAACARQQIPASHFSALMRPVSYVQGMQLPLSVHGNASAHLLPGLFLPMDEPAAQAYIQAMHRHGHEGLFGQDECGCYRFDPTLRYQQIHSGIPAAALSHIHAAPVYTPYAAALCLPFAPRAAADCLHQFKLHGALTPLGMCDAIDFTNGAVLVGMHDAYHQGLLLIAAAHILADAPIRRYFCDQPDVEACLPLLVKQAAPILPSMQDRWNQSRPSLSASKVIHPSPHLAEGFLLGTKDFRLTSTSRGDSILHEGDIPLTRWNPAAPVNGIQFYLSDEGRCYRLGDPTLPGEITFAAGEFRMEKLCGSLKAELVSTVDTLRRRSIHVLTITNLSTRDRIIDIADCLLPDLDAPANTLEISRPDKRHLILRVRGLDRQLHHTVSTSHPELSISAYSDALAFTGRGCTLENPASMAEPPQDWVIPTVTPCLSFRLKLSLGGRGQAVVWFTTSSAEDAPPAFAALPGLRDLAALQHQAIDAAAPLTDTQYEVLPPLTGLLQEYDHTIHLTLDRPEGLALLEDLAAIAVRFKLHGYGVQIDVHCTPSQRDNADALLHDCLAQDMFRFVDTPSLPAALTLHSEASLAAQIQALQVLRPAASPAAKPPKPAQLPRQQLDFSCNYGGFYPETGAYLIQLEPEQTTPAPWQNTHAHAHYREVVDESGFHSPLEERLLLRAEDGTELSPWSQELPRIAHMEAGMTIWEAWSDCLDIRLCASVMPGHRCGFRVLRIRNATDTSLTLRIMVQARLCAANLPLDCAPGVVITQHPTGRMHPYLASQEWQARRAAYPAFHDGTDHPRGQWAILETILTLPPNALQEALWISGLARHADDIADALRRLHTTGASAMLHQIRAQWAQRLTHLTVSTPEDSFDLLMNRILPLQAITAQAPERVLVLTHLAPEEAKYHLLKTIRQAKRREDWARLIPIIQAYVQRTGDASILDVHLPSVNAALFDHCKQELLSLPKDPRGVPVGRFPARTCLQMAAAAQALDALRPDPALQEFARKLRNAADTYLWQDGFYGEPLHLDVQQLACIVYGATPRTRQAVRTAWAALYDQPHGFLKAAEAADLPFLPGLPENGGMVTSTAACFLRALLKTGHIAEAHELLQALNPIHHTDDPLRAETFRGAPYQLHGGMYASPMEAGQASPADGGQAAALLYDVILQDILGVRRRGNLLQIRPCVPADWEEYSLTLQEGASTWHISAERRIKQPTIDGNETDVDIFPLQDDGRIHQVRIPLK